MDEPSHTAKAVKENGGRFEWSSNRLLERDLERVNLSRRGEGNGRAYASNFYQWVKNSRSRKLHENMLK